MMQSAATISMRKRLDRKRAWSALVAVRT